MSTTSRYSAPRSPCTSARPDRQGAPAVLSAGWRRPGGQLYSRSHEQTTETGMNPPQPRLIDNGNGHPLASHWYRPAGEPRGYLLIVPAMGVEQRFYAPFAAWLAERGYLAITFDYLGMGQSRNGSLRGLEVDVLGWARHDCSAMLAAALAESGASPCTGSAIAWAARSCPSSKGASVSIGSSASPAAVATGRKTALGCATRSGCSGTSSRPC